MTMNEYVLALCLAVLEVANPAKPADRAMSVCYTVGEAADRRGASVEIAIALAYTESRLNPKAASDRRARGALQVIPVWHCPGRRERGCDLIEAGIGALLRYERKYGPRWEDILCHWSQGNGCWSVGRRFARTVMDRADLFRHASMTVGGDE